MVDSEHPGKNWPWCFQFLSNLTVVTKTISKILISDGGDEAIFKMWWQTVKVKGKGAGLWSTSSDTALPTAQLIPDHWAYSFLIPSQLPREHTAWLLIGAQNWSTGNAITALTVPFFTYLVWRGSGNGLAQVHNTTFNSKWVSFTSNNT